MPSQIIEESATLAISKKAKELISSGVDVVDLSVGEPDFDTPNWIKKATIEAIRKGNLRYTPPAGLFALRKAIVEDILSKYNVNYCPDEVLVSCGAKQALFNVIWALCSSGDSEVFIFRPYWVSYPAQAKLANAKVYILDTDKFFIPKIEQLPKNFTSKTRIIIINSPNNPSGAVYSSEFLDKLLQIAIDRKYYLISDEIYREFVYDQKFCSILNFIERYPVARDHVIVVDGLSKSFSMTGWRIGYCVGPKEVIQKATNIQSHITTCAPTMSQLAAIKSIKHHTPKEIINEFKLRKKISIEYLSKCNLFEVIEPQGAFYIFPKLSFKNTNSVDVANYLLDVGHVAVVPGVAFGMDGYLRICYAVDRERLIEGLKRITSCLQHYVSDK